MTDPTESADADPGDEHRVQWYCTGGIPRWGWTFWARQGDEDPFREPWRYEVGPNGGCLTNLPRAAVAP